MYFTPDDTLARDRKPELYHMVLFAQNEKGYVNLMQTVSEAAVQGFYYKPRVTLDNLRRHREGLIASSACIAGIIPKCIDRGEMDKAIEWAETFRDTFEPGNFYIEIQEHGITTGPGITDEELSIKRPSRSPARWGSRSSPPTTSITSPRRRPRPGRGHVHRHRLQEN